MLIIDSPPFFGCLFGVHKTAFLFYRFVFYVIKMWVFCVLPWKDWGEDVFTTAEIFNYKGSGVRMEMFMWVNSTEGFLRGYCPETGFPS